MSNISRDISSYNQEVWHESRYYPNFRDAVEEHHAAPGEEIHLELELEPVTNYWGQERAILVRENVSTFGVMPDDFVAEWWDTIVAAKLALETVYVDGRLWTSHDWETKFYASAQVKVPAIADVPQIFEDDYVEITDEHRAGVAGFENVVEEPWLPTWPGQKLDAAKGSVAGAGDALEARKKANRRTLLGCAIIFPLVFFLMATCGGNSDETGDVPTETTTVTTQ